jgi:hypothetical protein
MVFFYWEHCSCSFGPLKGIINVRTEDGFVLAPCMRFDFQSGPDTG